MSLAYLAYLAYLPAIYLAYLALYKLHIQSLSHLFVLLFSIQLQMMLAYLLL